jgi:hypothetical protein
MKLEDKQAAMRERYARVVVKAARGRRIEYPKKPGVRRPRGHPVRPLDLYDYSRAVEIAIRVLREEPQMNPLLLDSLANARDILKDAFELMCEENKRSHA